MIAIRRRQWLRGALGSFALLPGLSALASCVGSSAPAASRVRPGDAGWPSAAQWAQLNEQVGGRLLAVRSPFADCAAAPDSAACAEVFAKLRNPYYLGDEPGLTQTLGWVDAWTSRPSVYAVAVENSADVVAAVDFARAHNLRLVVKGGGHSYQGTSASADSLLVWTRRMKAITLHDAFVAAGCEGSQAPQPAVSIEAGALWGQAYDAVTTKAGRYVQGGGCLTVGVAGLVQSGGFGSFSKAYGLAAASLLEAEVVTADGRLRIANACSHPDLFWALKGGGGGSFGVVTRLTLRTHDLPETVGAIFATLRATSDAAFRRLVARIVAFYREALFSAQWGEQIALRPDNSLSISMLFQGLDQEQAESVWRPFFEGLAAAPEDFVVEEGPSVLTVPARRFWDPEFLRSLPGIVLTDDRPGAAAGNVFYAGNEAEAGQVLHAYQSCWLPAALLQTQRQDELVEALYAASRHWSVGLHFNKGLAGAPAEVLAAARDTATNPAVRDAFALAICGAEGPPAWPGIAQREPDAARARRDAAAVASAMGELRRLVPQPGSYLAESDYFQADWQRAFWGENYARLLAVKRKYDPDGLFFVHHGVGTEGWSADGFSRVG